MGRKWLIVACLAAVPARISAQIAPEAQVQPVEQTAPAPASEALVPTDLDDRTAPPKLVEPTTAPTAGAGEQAAPVKPAERPKPGPAPKPRPVPAKPKPSSIVDAELSGIATNQLSDTLYGRLRIERNTENRLWFIRTSYASTSNDTVSGIRIVTTKTRAMRLDSEFRRSRSKRYDFLAAAYNVRGRSPANLTYPGRSGYYLAYGGKGRPLGPKAEGGIGLGILYDYDDGSRTRPAAVGNIQGNTPINRRLALDGRVLLIQPFNDWSLKLDGEGALQYQLMQGLFLRLGHTATNLVRPTRGTGLWNRSWRLSLLFRYMR